MARTRRKQPTRAKARAATSKNASPTNATPAVSSSLRVPASNAAPAPSSSLRAPFTIKVETPALNSARGAPTIKVKTADDTIPMRGLLSTTRVSRTRRVSPLSSVPPEILTEIAGLVRPSDLVSFALACKGCYAASSKALTDRRDHQRNSNRCEMTTEDGVFTGVATLNVWLAQPRHAYYIRHLSISTWPHSFREHEVSDHAMRRLQIALRKRGFGGSDPFFRYLNHLRHINMIVMLSLCSLPNLRRIVLSTHGVNHELVILGLKRVMTRRSSTIFPNLMDIHLSLRGPGSEAAMGGYLSIFLACPSMERITLAGTPELPAIGRVTPKSSQVGHFLIDGSTVAPDGCEWLDRLLDAPQALKAFELNWPVNRANFCASSITDALVRHQRESLEFLSVRTQQTTYQSLLRQLHTFPNLRYLCANFGILTNCQEIYEENARRILPASIECLLLCEDSNLDGRGMAEAIRDLVSHKARLFPALKQMQVCFAELHIQDAAGNPWEPHLEHALIVMTACEEVGIEYHVHYSTSPETWEFKICQP